MATSTAGVTLRGFLGRLDAHGAELGLVVAAGLAGGALVAILATVLADRVGRRRFLLIWSASERTQIIARYDGPRPRAPAMKIAYDILLWRAFRGLKPPEECV
jgi:hypothetical protein